MFLTDYKQTLAYIMQRYPYVYPIVGGRRTEHLKSNIETLSLKLSDQEIDEIENVATFDVGFPMNMLFGMQNIKAKHNSGYTSGDIDLVKMAFYLDIPEKKLLIRPHGLMNGI
jgi:uncharacterized protein YebE (UPF0316 family)